MAYGELIQFPAFQKAGTLEETLRAVEAWKHQTGFDDRLEVVVPSEKYSNFAVHLAALYKASDYTQTKLQDLFNGMYDMLQGSVQATLFAGADTNKYKLVDVIKKKLGIDYKPAKNNKDNGSNGSVDVAARDGAGEEGRQDSTETPADGEPAKSGEESAERGGRTSDDSREVAEQPAAVTGQSLQQSVETASGAVAPHPTEAQKKAGNYKKGHVKVGGFDISIENPAGSVRSGTDANGKKWETTMANAYGYIKGTESVDGDHIDVFLAGDMDAWNGRKVFVVDQTKPDGTFDEHKVMLGFNDKDEAYNAYLANYDKDWERTHQGLRISEVSIDDFNKWIQSSKRKTKAFAEYSTVSKITDNAQAEGAASPGKNNQLDMSAYHTVTDMMADEAAVTSFLEEYCPGKTMDDVLNGRAFEGFPDGVAAVGYTPQRNYPLQVFFAGKNGSRYNLSYAAKKKRFELSVYDNNGGVIKTVVEDEKFADGKDYTKEAMSQFLPEGLAEAIKGMDSSEEVGSYLLQNFKIPPIVEDGGKLGFALVGKEFNEWAKEKLEEAEKEVAQKETSGRSPREGDEPGADAPGAVTMWKTKKSAFTDANSTKPTQISDLNGSSEGKVSETLPDKQGNGQKSSAPKEVEKRKATATEEQTEESRLAKLEKEIGLTDQMLPTEVERNDIVGKVIGKDGTLVGEDGKPLVLYHGTEAEGLALEMLNCQHYLKMFLMLSEQMGEALLSRRMFL